MPVLANFVDIHQLVTAICHRIDVATDREPWQRLTRSERIDHLPPLVAALIDGIVAGDRGATDDLLDNAYTHGCHRREQRIDEEHLLDEYYILRDQVYRTLRADHDFHETVSLTYVLDPWITEATVESLMGLHGAPRRTRPTL